MIFIPPPPTSRQIGRKLGKLLATMRKLQTPVKPQPTTPQHTMSTTTQRPTPETDAAEINLGSACGQFSEWYVKPDFARKLEHERDEAREELENWKASGIHSCHDECKRPLCVANRKMKAMREAIKNIYYLTEGYADGAPDASAHDKLCNEIADKLKPLIKP